MQKILHRSEERGYFNHDWLETYHSFSFGGWLNRNKMNFGKLRVLNDDTIAPDTGFGLHPHDNMEIITIMLEGELKHTDSMGNEGIIRENEIQVMSAGSGIMHSEFNASATQKSKLLQIWIFPNERNIKPRYDQTSFINDIKKNELISLVGPKDSGIKIWINQSAYISSSKLDLGNDINYSLHNSSNGVYVFVIDGAIKIDEDILDKRDAIGIWDCDGVKIEAIENSEVLIIEVPMD